MASSEYDPLSDDGLLTAIEAFEADSQSQGELSEERIEALDRYLGEPYGNEVDGRSQVVSRDTWDTIEWIKPQLADIFCGGDEVVAFTARGPEDEQGAEQETDYVNWTVTQRNNWFEIWNGWSHDGLLQKVGYVLAYWDDANDRAKERYEGLSDQEFAMLQYDDEVEVVEHEQRPVFGGMVPMMFHDCTVVRTRAPEVVRIVNVPPENVRVSKHARSLSLQDPRLDFVEHTEKKTISELRAEGFDVPDDIGDDGDDGETTFEAQMRDKLNPLRDSTEDDADPSMRRVTVRHVWIRYDCDGDGLAELRDVIVIGKQIYQNDETDVVNLVALTPYMLPHQHAGLSVHDAVKDIEEIKTALLRAGLDNQYLANNGRYGVDVDAVNMDDMLDSRPGGVVRFKSGLSQTPFVPLTHPTSAAGAVELIQYIDTVSNKRTGVNEQSQGLDQNTLNRTFGGAQLLLTAAQQRIKFIARTFAETAVKPLFQVVHQLTLTHSRKETIVKLRGNWVPVDPRQWQKRTDLQISVALGAGDKPQQMSFLGQTLEMQMKLVGVGLASPPKVYNTLSRMARIAGYRDPAEFWDDPSKSPPKPQGPPPEVQREMAKGQTALALEDKRQQGAAMQAQIDASVQRQNKQDELQVQAANDQRDAERQALQARLDSQAADADRRQAVLIEQMKAMESRFESELDARVRLIIAGMNQQAASLGGFGA